MVERIAPKEYGPPEQFQISTEKSVITFKKETLAAAVKEEVVWMNDVRFSLESNETSQSWSSYHASQKRSSNNLPCINAIYPLI